MIGEEFSELSEDDRIFYERFGFMLIVGQLEDRLLSPFSDAEIFNTRVRILKTCDEDGFPTTYQLNAHVTINDQ